MQLVVLQTVAIDSSRAHNISTRMAMHAIEDYPTATQHQLGPRTNDIAD
jgi:hypothetical protein